MWPARQSPKQAQGRLAEDRALLFLQEQGLRLVQANFQCKLGEIDLILQDGPVLVFVEVRERARGSHGGAAASITRTKVKRIVRAAQYYLLRYPRVPPCRIDVIAIDAHHLDWLRDAIQV
jgi:putative endonuclease